MDREETVTLAREEVDSMDKAAGKRLLVYPYDRRLPRIRILTSQSKALQGSRVVVRIDAWPVTSQFPQVQILLLLLLLLLSLIFPVLCRDTS